MILTGVFASSAVNGVSGLIEGNVRQFGVEVMAGVLTAAFSFGATWLILKIINHFTPVRVLEEVEKKGLDEAELGETSLYFVILLSCSLLIIHCI